MPTKSDHRQQPEYTLSDTLVADLEKVTRIIHEEFGKSPSCSEALALIRIVESVEINDWAAFASKHGLENWLCVPLHCEISESVTQLLSLQEKLAFQRDHDALTGIGNRGYFNRLFEHEVERALRSQNELSLIYIDLDNFKQINDNYSHECGDIVLQRLSMVLQKSVRQYDIVARLGGEEFAVILPSTSCWAGITLGNRILETFSQEVFNCNGTSFSMTFSGGVSSLNLLENAEKNSQGLLNSADAALYLAKSKGKSNITLAESRRFAKDRESLVQVDEKQFLFSFLGSE